MKEFKWSPDIGRVGRSLASEQVENPLPQELLNLAKITSVRREPLPVQRDRSGSNNREGEC